MKLVNVKFIKGASKHYPLWDKITVELQEKIVAYHNILKKEGYEIKAVNIAQKDKKVFWILCDKEHVYLEQYGILY